MTRTVIVSARPHAFGRLGGGLKDHAGDRARRDRDPRCARAQRARGRRGRLRDHGPGAAGGRGPGAGAAGGGRRGAADRGPGRHGEQGVRVVDPRGRDRRLDDPRRRRRGRRHRRHGVDVERAVRAAEGALRLQDGRRDARRPDDLGRPALDLRRAAHGAAGRAASRASSASRARSRTSWALRSHERAAKAQDDGAFDDEIVPVGERRRRRGHSPRHVARAARCAQAGDGSRRGRSRPATRRASTTARRA